MAARAPPSGESPAHRSVLQPVPVAEGRSDLLRHGIVSVHPGVVGDGPQLSGIDLAVGHDRLVGGDVDDPSDEDLHLLVVTHDLAFGGQWELFEHGGVNVGGLRGVESRPGDLVGDIVARYNADIVGCHDGVHGCRAHGERAGALEVGSGPMGAVDAYGDPVLAHDPAPGGVHGVGGPVLVVCSDDVTTCGYSRVLAPRLFLMKGGWRNVPITMTRRSRSEAADGDDIHPVGASVTVFGSSDDHLERRETYAVAGILLIGPPDLLLEFVQAPPALFD